MTESIKHIEEEIEHLHQTLEETGKNSRRIKSLDGQTFSVPVDHEHKATRIPFSQFGNPHMRAFHASWFGFFSTFFSTFAPAPLAPVLKKSSTLGLTRAQLSLGNLMSVTSNIICRVLMGVVCDKMGARKGLAFVLLITAPFIIGLAFVQSAAGFIACRFFIGMGLASFVACQVWCTQMFSKSVVGMANATAGGWGNLGGGVTTLLMGQVFVAFMSATNGNENVSWRLCMMVPLLLHLVSAAFVLTGQDLPDGNYAALEKQGSKQKSRSDIVTKVGLSNVNAWILTLTYGFCFGVELTVTNVATQYFYEFFALTQAQASLLASVFGLTNIVARSLGGICSDWSGRRFGMRGRIWALWLWQTLQGIVCIILGSITTSYGAPDFGGPEDVTGYVQVSGWVRPTTSGYVDLNAHSSAWVAFNGSCVDERLVRCGSLQVTIKDSMRSCLDERFTGLGTVVLSEPPFLGNNCVSNSGLLALAVVLLFVFSVCVQMAEGLTYGIVPSVSRPALGVVSGMVGAGGNAGALITNALFFTGDSLRTDLGFVYMGYSIIGVTALCGLIYFPDQGGMLFRAGALSYDPQRIKPPSGYRGADSMDYTAGVDQVKPTPVTKLTMAA